MLGMVAGGGFVLTPLAPAAVVYTVIIGISTSAAVARIHDPIAALLAALMAGYTVVTVAAVYLGRAPLGGRAARGARGGAAGPARRAAAEGLRIAIGRRDVGDRRAGRLVRITPKLTALMRLDETASRRSLLGWFERQAADAEARDAVAQLRQAFAAGQAFRQRGIPVAVAGSRGAGRSPRVRWWTRPALDQGWRGVITDITLEHDAQSRMQQLALVDSLTGLANRTQLRDKLQLKLDVGRAAGRPRCCA